MTSYNYVVHEKSINIIKIKKDNYTERSIHKKKINEQFFNEIKSKLDYCVGRDESETKPILKEIYKQIDSFKGATINYHGFKFCYATKTISYHGAVMQFSQMLVDDVLNMILEDSKILNKFDSNQKMDAYLKFLSNLVHSNRYHIVNELYDFIMYNDVEIDNEGNVICYKIVRSDFKDIYTGKIDNSVGKTVQMEQSKISDDRNESCSFGLHAASLHYLKYSRYGCTHYESGHLLKIAVAPQDFVSVPYDYNGSKARVCAYKVIEEVNMDLIK